MLGAFIKRLFAFVAALCKLAALALVLALLALGNPDRDTLIRGAARDLGIEAEGRDREAALAERLGGGVLERRNRALFSTLRLTGGRNGDKLAAAGAAGVVVGPKSLGRLERTARENAAALLGLVERRAGAWRRALLAGTEGEERPEPAETSVAKQPAASPAEPSAGPEPALPDPPPEEQAAVPAELPEERPADREAAPPPAEKQAAALESAPFDGPVITNSLGMEFALIPAGTFMMGSPRGEGEADERPRHGVVIEQPFYLGRREVTQAQWQAVMGTNPSRFRGADLPVENVSWEDAREFIRRLNEREGHGRYRLPTEAEWEYAARAGSGTSRFFGDETLLDDYAWHIGNAGERTHAAGEKRPNPWGLYDIYGNVWEWVHDWYGPYGGAEWNPRGPAAGERRVLRGGSWNYAASSCRSARRLFAAPDSRHELVGFRVALAAE